MRAPTLVSARRMVVAGVAMAMLSVPAVGAAQEAAVSEMGVAAGADSAREAAYARFGVAAPAASGEAPAATTAGVIVTDLGLDAAAIVYDPVRHVVYAAVSARDPNYPETVVRIDPATGAVTRSTSALGDPWTMAISDDGSYLYVGLDDDNSVVRIPVGSFTADLQVDLGTDGYEMYAGDLAVLPGSRKSWAVARRYQAISPPGAGVAVYDSGTMRSDTTPGHISEDSIIFGHDPGTLYGADLCCTSRSFFVVAVDGSGANRVSETNDLFGQRLVLARFPFVYTSAGSIIDVGGPTPKKGGALSKKQQGGALGYNGFADALYLAGATNTGPYLVEVFDAATHQRTQSFEIPINNDPYDLIPFDDGSLLIQTRRSTFPISHELLLLQPAGTISGKVTDRHDGAGVNGICVFVTPFGDPGTLVADTETDAKGNFSVDVEPGSYQVVYVDCAGWDYAAEWFGTTQIEEVQVDAYGTADASFALTTSDMTGLVDPSQGMWHLTRPRNNIVKSFFFGNPGDYPMMGDWDCDGVDTPGLYRRADGFVYLRNSNTAGEGEIKFFFGNPGDLPLAGDFNGDGCDTVSIYRPAEGRIFIINKLGKNNGGLGAAEKNYYFGNPGDKAFVGDFDFDGIDTIGLHRESTGLVYFNNEHRSTPADKQFIFGDPGDRLVAGNFSGFWVETPAIFRGSDLTFYIRHENTQGNADRTQFWGFAGPDWLPVAGVYGL